MNRFPFSSVAPDDFFDTKKNQRSLSITPAGDLEFTLGAFVWGSSKQTVSQKIVSVLRRSKQEWFLHPHDGIDWPYLVQQPAESTHLFSYAITQMIQKWIPYLQILDLQINFSYPSKTLCIFLTCLVDDNPHLVTTHV